MDSTWYCYLNATQYYCVGWQGIINCSIAHLLRNDSMVTDDIRVGRRWFVPFILGSNLFCPSRWASAIFMLGWKVFSECDLPDSLLLLVNIVLVLHKRLGTFNYSCQSCTPLHGTDRVAILFRGHLPEFLMVIGIYLINQSSNLIREVSFFSSSSIQYYLWLRIRISVIFRSKYLVDGYVILVNLPFHFLPI